MLSAANNNTAYSRQSRICYNDNHVLAYYANYSIVNDKINLQSLLPKLPLDSNGTIQGGDHQIIEESSKSVGQLLILTYRYDRKQKKVTYSNPNQTTFFLVKDTQEFAFSVYHAYKHNRRQIFIGSFSDIDLYPKFYDFCKEIQLNNTYITNANIINKMNNFNTRFNGCFILKIKEEFLKNRKAFLKMHKKTGHELFKDAEFGLKFVPALDLIAFTTENVPEAKRNFLKIGNVKDDEICYLIGYHQTMGSINPRSAEYKKSKFTKEMEIQDFINTNKSIGVCIVNKINKSDTIVNFSASTGMGSSGSPVINRQGEVSFMSNGNFLDIEYEEIIAPDDIKIIENKNNYIKCKNRNIGLKMSHVFIKNMFRKNKKNSGRKTINKISKIIKLKCKKKEKKAKSKKN
jgi:hypothetical protein